MPDDLVFRGSLLDYWKKLNAELQHSSRQNPLAPPPFKLWQHIPPQAHQEVTIEFLDAQQRLGLITVDATQTANRKSVKLLVHDSEEAYQPQGAPSLAAWDKLRKAWQKKDWLIDPYAQFQSKQERGGYKQDHTQKKLEELKTVRREFIHKNKYAPTMYDALDMAGLSRYLFVKFAPDLFKNWKILDYE